MDTTQLQTDEELIRAFQSNANELAFKQLMERYKGKVYGKARNLLSDEVAAEDITQEVFVKVYFNLKRFRFDSAFNTWLFKITINQCYGYLRKHKTEFQTRTQSSKEESINDAQNTMKKIDIDRILSRLPARERIILLLKYRENYSYTEIADVFDLKESAVKMRISRAKQAFEKLYKRN